MKKRILIEYCLVMLTIFLSGCEPKQSGLYQISTGLEETEHAENVEKQEENQAMEMSLDVNDESIQEDIIDENAVDIMYVHVCGAVNNPGVYEFETGDRVFRAVEKAGGFTEDAEENYVNLAEYLSDGMKIIVPTISQIEKSSENETYGVIDSSDGEGGPESKASSGKININTADENQMCNITGIGPSKAKAIVEYRNMNGLFNKTEDIMNVSGIGKGTYDKIKDEIITGNE